MLNIYDGYDSSADIINYDNYIIIISVLINYITGKMTYNSKKNKNNNLLAASLNIPYSIFIIEKSTACDTISTNNTYNIFA